MPNRTIWISEIAVTQTHNRLNEVATRARRRFPDHQVDVPYQVCLPVYEVRLRLTELAEDDLSTPARFVLRLANAGATQPQEIGGLLGMSQTYVAKAASELLNENLVTQTPTLDLTVTTKGKQALRDGGRTWRPRNRHVHVSYDPLTKRVVDVDSRQLLNRDDVRKNGLFILPSGPRRPRLSNIRLDEVKNCLQLLGLLREGTEILEVSDIKNMWLRYRDDVILVKLDAANADSSLFAAFRAQQYLEEESAAIQRVADRGADIVPEDLRPQPDRGWVESPSLTREESGLLKEINGLDQSIGEVKQAVSEARTTRSVTQDSQERIDLEARIKILELEKEALESTLADRDRELERISNGNIRLIKTEEHHSVLLKAIREASSQVTLVSAWIDPYAFDDEVCRLLAAAIGRGVHVRIAWGLGVRRRGFEASRNREKGISALNKLKGLIPRHLRSNLTEKIADTHEKFIICDDLFCAWGSFNWLSYRGQRDSGYRRETSSYSERPDDIAIWTANAEGLFG